eukprot:4112671-Amphidinium_carterae.2
MPNTTTGINKKSKTHGHDIPTYSNSKFRRIQNPQSINRKQPSRSHDEVLGDSEDQEAQRDYWITSLHWQQFANKSTNMISRGTLRPRGNYTSRPRGTTPQPRPRLPAYVEVNEEYIVKVEERDEGELPMVRLQYFAEEAARDDVIEDYENYEDDIKTQE